AALPVLRRIAAPRQALVLAVVALLARAAQAVALGVAELLRLALAHHDRRLLVCLRHESLLGPTHGHRTLLAERGEIDRRAVCARDLVRDVEPEPVLARALAARRLRRAWPGAYAAVGDDQHDRGA